MLVTIIISNLSALPRITILRKNTWNSNAARFITPGTVFCILQCSSIPLMRRPAVEPGTGTLAFSPLCKDNKNKVSLLVTPANQDKGKYPGSQ